MKYMSGNEIRKMWLDFFKSKQHRIIESSSLIPFDDPTLLWVNAGIAPLKKYFDGTLIPPAKRLVNIQKCLRTNDIENVGYTARHHTFFEMLGNFSIGDYFKEEAINFAYELLTSDKYFNFPLEKLYMTYHPDDLDAKTYWLNLGIKESHLIPVEGNFWEIGEGPCGPNSEIFFDRGSDYDQRGVELIKDDIDNDRYIEIWNIVFSQYNAKPGVKRSDYEELPSKNIDTGAGLERFACVLQNTKTNFETDLFWPIIKELETISKVKYTGQTAFKIIADHLKTLVMTIADGAILSNEGRGYVLRRLLRRALKHGKSLNINGAYLYKLIDSVIEIMGQDYPNIIENKDFVSKVILAEELKFLETLSIGEQMIEKLVKEKGKIIKEDSFLLFDTYGFPIELQKEYADEHHIFVDEKGFYELLKEQQKRSRESRTQTSSMASQQEEYILFKKESVFIGYDTLQTKAKVIKVYESGIVLDETPFYATKGGQEADKGTINGLEVLDVTLLPNGQHLHVVEGKFKENEEVFAEVDKENRKKITQNHTATHLLHQALKAVLGKHVNQQGSLVSKDFLRFDFNHYENPTDEQILQIEQIVKTRIKESLTVMTTQMDYDKALKSGAIALFGEKYDDVVRVVNIENKSIELCGGTHVNNTIEIENFLIASVFSIGSGVYRVEAFTGQDSIAEFKKRNKGFLDEIKFLILKQDSLFKETGNTNLDKDTMPKLQGSYQDVISLKNYLKKLKETNYKLELKLKEQAERKLHDNKEDLIKNKRNNLIVTKDIETNLLRGLLFELYDKIKCSTLLILNLKDGKITYMVKTDQNNAREIIQKLNEISGGSGGGKVDFATGGTSNLETLEELINYMETIE